MQIAETDSKQAKCKSPAKADTKLPNVLVKAEMTVGLSFTAG